MMRAGTILVFLLGPAVQAPAACPDTLDIRGSWHRSEPDLAKPGLLYFDTFFGCGNVPAVLEYIDDSGDIRYEVGQFSEHESAGRYAKKGVLAFDTEKTRHFLHWRSVDPSHVAVEVRNERGNLLLPAVELEQRFGNQP